MTVEVYESGNRRAEITGRAVAFLRVTGNVRKSAIQVWWCERGTREARRLARAWAFEGRLGERVVG